MAGKYKVDIQDTCGRWKFRAGFKSRELARREIGRMARGDASLAGLVYNWRVRVDDVELCKFTPDQARELR